MNTPTISISSVLPTLSHNREIDNPVRTYQTVRPGSMRTTAAQVKPRSELDALMFGFTSESVNSN